jgi:hypothetical protein
VISCEATASFKQKELEVDLDTLVESGRRPGQRQSIIRIVSARAPADWARITETKGFTLVTRDIFRVLSWPSFFGNEVAIVVRLLRSSSIKYLNGDEAVCLVPAFVAARIVKSRLIGITLPAPFQARIVAAAKRANQC